MLKGIRKATAFEELRNLAVSRIYLDNFDHITAYWVSLGLPVAQQALNYGVDDLHGTIMEEKIFHMAGATTPQHQSCAGLEKAIREAGREPMQRDTWYRRIEPTWRTAPASELDPRARPRVTRYPALAGLRIGCVQYLNSKPLIHGYEGPVVFDHPSGLARELAAGKLDAALVPIFEVLRGPRYLVADGVAIACDGPVFSVFLAYRGPLSSVKTIALDPASLTSVHLLQVLLSEFHGLHPQCLDGRHCADADAQLLIGNQAIDFRLADGGRHQLLDLGAEWKRCTGLPFVFAVWALREDFSDPAAVAAGFRALKKSGLAAIPEIVAGDATHERELAVRYLTEHIRFDLGEREKSAIARFAELLVKWRLIAETPPALRYV